MRSRDVWTLDRLGPGEQLSLSWDGREFATVPTIVACADEGQFPSSFDGMDARCLRGPLLPAAQGPYRASFLVYGEATPFLPAECGDAETCEFTNDIVGVSDVKKRCGGGRPSATLHVDFTLPATGEVVVPVPIE